MEGWLWESGPQRAPGPPASCLTAPSQVPAAQHGEHVLVELGRRGLSLADWPDRQTALQRELGTGRPTTLLGCSGRRQLARPAGCLMSPTQFFTPYFSNKKAVRLQPQPSGRRAPEPPGSMAAFPTSSRVPRAGLGGSVGKHVGDYVWESHMFWGGEEGLQPRTWAAPKAGPDPSEGKVVERPSIVCLSGSLTVCIWEAQSPHYVCTWSQRQTQGWRGGAGGLAGAQGGGKVGGAGPSGLRYWSKLARRDGPGPSFPPSLPATALPAPSMWVSQRGQTLLAAASHSPAPPARLACSSFTDLSSQSSPGGFQLAASNLLCAKESNRLNLFQLVLGGIPLGAQGAAPWPIGCQAPGEARALL